MQHVRRRDLLVGTAFALLGKAAGAEVIAGKMPWSPNAESPPLPFRPGGWAFFTAAEGTMIEAIADRIIPPDPDTPGGKDAGCAVFLDRQLAGAYGHDEGLYNKGPFHEGTKQQGPQSAKSTAEQYRAALAALDRHCHAQRDAKGFADLPAERQDEILTGLENGTVELDGLDAKTFFEHLRKDVQMGFFADPVYGGNRDMCAWKMIGFPGAHYDYRDFVDRHNERYPHPPVAITGRPGWIPGRG